MMDSSDEEVQDRMTQEIQMVVPQFPDEPTFCEIFRWPEAVCLSSPGQIPAMQRLKVAVNDYQGLDLAGEYLNLPSVEGAIDSGVKAARRVLKHG
jgi:protoporphyrinogen oxidase